MPPTNSALRPSRSGLFKSTRWQDLIVRAGAAKKERDSAAAAVYQIYWRPLFRILRCRGYNFEEAQDHAQAFLIQFIRSDALARAEASRARFRDYLVGALDNFLCDQRDRERTLKRGGGAAHVELNEITDAEIHSATGCPGPHFDSPHDGAWAARFLVTIVDYLELTHMRSGRGALFRLLKPHLFGGTEKPQPYWKLALRLHRAPATLRKDVERIRAQFRELVRDQFRQLYGNARVEEEMQNLREILRHNRGLL